MDPKRTGSALIALLAVLSLGWGGMYYYAKRAEVAATPQAAQSEVPEGRITLTHETDGDMHTFTGVVETPTPCYTVAAALGVSYEVPPVGTINITTAEEQSAVCTQVVTEQEFVVAFSSDAAPEIKVMVNGTPRTVAVVEAN